MSLCRWSSDDWQCEIYAYGAAHGWVIHVAANRFDPPEDFPRTPPYPENVEANSPEFRRWVDSLIQTNREQTDYFNRVGHALAPIGGPHDGATFDGLDNEELVDTLVMLQEAGYRFPRGVLDGAREELAEEGSDYAV